MAIKKVTVNLPEDQVDYLQKIAQSQHISFTEALKRAIASEKFFNEQEEQGSKILVEDNKQQLRHIVRR